MKKILIIFTLCIICRYGEVIDKKFFMSSDTNWIYAICKQHTGYVSGYVAGYKNSQNDVLELLKRKQLTLVF